jgi:hypothetical protein
MFIEKIYKMGCLEGTGVPVLYIGRTVSKVNMLHTLCFFSSKFCLFHKATFFGSCIIRILHTGCAKI